MRFQTFGFRPENQFWRHYCHLQGVRSFFHHWRSHRVGHLDIEFLDIQLTLYFILLIFSPQLTLLVLFKWLVYKTKAQTKCFNNFLSYFFFSQKYTQTIWFGFIKFSLVKHHTLPLVFDVLFLYFVKSAQKTEKDELEGDSQNLQLV